jgi:hypothetical protein
MRSDEDKIYIKIVALKEIYNFVIDDFFILNHLRPKNFIFIF